MKCSSCGKENKPDAKFCKYCGNKLDTKFKTCKNGHNYSAALEQCPYCPQSTQTGDAQTFSEQKTILDQKTDIESEINSESKNEPNEPEKPQVNRKPTQSNKTVFLSKDPDDDPGSEKQVRKLVGWLVSFDLNPAGLDYRLYEGRYKIGRSNLNDIVIDDQSVSDEHAILLYRDGSFIIQDQLSTNGTFINDKQLENRVELNDSDEIRFGNIKMKIKII